MLVIRNQIVLRGGGQRRPVIHILIIVEVLTPLNQSVHILVKLRIINLFELLIVKGVLVQGLQLLLELH